MRFSELLEKFLQREGYLEFTIVDIKHWIMSEHLKKREPIPLPLTVKRYANRLYKIVHPNNQET
jgi:hypothetical protein